MDKHIILGIICILLMLLLLVHSLFVGSLGTGLLAAVMGVLAIINFLQ